LDGARCNAFEEVAFTGRVVYIGYAKDEVAYQTKLFVMKEADIRGSRNALAGFTDVIRMLEQGAFPVQDVITRVVPLEQAGEALREWDRNAAAVTKILVEMPA
jgi:threonine dehydrogenase-like Zn-dependent dehydrogenase